MPASIDGKPEIKNTTKSISLEKFSWRSEKASLLNDRSQKKRSLIHNACLLYVWICFLVSGIVMFEPAPIDGMQLSLIFLLPIVGLVLFNNLLIIYLTLWLSIAATSYIATLQAHDISAAISFVSVSLYLYIFSSIIAAFIACSPKVHSKFIMSGWSAAAIVCAGIGLVGYGNLIPGGYELFTKYGRLSGPFKDPNVAGAFFIAPILYFLQLSIFRPVAISLLALLASVLVGFALLLTFSRGAWLGLTISLLAFGYIQFVFTQSRTKRLKIVLLGIVGTVSVVLILLFALQFGEISALLSERASLTQSYDTSAEGRFSGQQKAIKLISANPLGLGAQEFPSVHHLEEAHNVYLSMFMNAGWLGGGLYFLLVLVTLVLGARSLFVRWEAQPVFAVAYSTFLAISIQGMFIDTDHWRHFYLLMAIVWGHLAQEETRKTPLNKTEFAPLTSEKLRNS